MAEKSSFKKESLSIIRDVIIAAIVVGIVLGSVVAYTANWPPLVVIESKSMIHTEGESIIGAIDPGDLVLVKDVSERTDIITYVEGVESIKIEAYAAAGTQVADKTVKGKQAAHATYSSPGDVIVYYKNGNTDQTPIIHRAIVWIVYNDTAGGSFDVPDLDLYGLDGRLVLNDVGYRSMTVSISFDTLLSNGFKSTGEPHSGFITLGDHNGASYDQAWLSEDGGPLVEPITPSWIMGKARGEIPWFGALKLYFGERDSPGVGWGAVPSNSKTNMVLTVGLLIGFAVSLDVISFYMETRRKKRGGGEEASDEVTDDNTPSDGDGALEGDPPNDGAPDEDAAVPPDDHSVGEAPVEKSSDVGEEPVVAPVDQQDPEPVEPAPADPTDSEVSVPSDIDETESPTNKE